MSAKDKFHEEVKRALIKERWTVTADPLRFDYGGAYFQVDLAADRLLAAERNGEKIAIEIKSFLNPSTVTDFYGAVGQYLCYRLALQQVQPDRKLFLAVPLRAYRSFFQTQFAQLAIVEFQLSLIVYDSENEVITQWL
jgi:XisH protein